MASKEVKQSQNSVDQPIVPVDEQEEELHFDDGVFEGLDALSDD